MRLTRALSHCQRVSTISQPLQAHAWLTSLTHRLCWVLMAALRSRTAQLLQELLYGWATATSSSTTPQPCRAFLHLLWVVSTHLQATIPLQARALSLPLKWYLPTPSTVRARLPVHSTAGLVATSCWMVLRLARCCSTLGRACTTTPVRRI